MILEEELEQVKINCYDKLAEPEEVLRQGLVDAEVTHSDETGLYVEGKRLWMHVVCTTWLTFYFYHEGVTFRRCESRDTVLLRL
jgi:hypothetical protein